MKKTKLDYFDGKELMPDNALRIGASSISGYFTYTASFFKELLHGENGFTGSTPSVLGSVLHYACECYVKNEPIDFEEISQYLVNQSTIVDDLNVDYINYQWPIMLRTVQQYLSTIDMNEAVAERFVTTEVRPGIYIGGSIDLLTRNTDGSLIINDYKSLSANSVSSMVYNYELQLLTYMYTLHKLGERVSIIRTINVTTDKCGRVGKNDKPLPDQPSKVIIHERAITPEDYEKMAAVFDIVSESVEMYIANPQMRGVIAQDNRVKLMKCLYKPFIEEEEI